MINNESIYRRLRHRLHPLRRRYVEVVGKFHLEARARMAYLRWTNQSVSYAGLSLYPYGSITTEIVETGQFEPLSGRFLLSHMPAKGVFIDIGANIGLFSLLLAHKRPNGRILAMEPTKKTFDVLEKNILLNDTENVEPFRVALADYNGEVNLFVNLRGRDGLNCIEKPIHEYARVVGTERVSVKKLDTLLEERGIAHVDLIKIDVEGAELLVLRGSRTLLTRSDAPTILFETSGLSIGFGYGPQDVIAFLQGFGYTVEQAPEMPDMWVAEKLVGMPDLPREESGIERINCAE